MSPLRNRIFRHLFAAQVIALLGTGLTTVALALLAYDLAGSGAGVVLGTALALKMIAYVGIAPVVGAFAHRLSRRPLLIGLDVARAGLILLFPFITEVWQIYVLVFALQACSAGFTPTFQATIPDILPDEAQYTRALSLSRLAYDLENLLSPALAAAALVYLSYSSLFGLNAVSFIVSALLIATVALPAAAPGDRETGILSNLTHGFRICLATPRLRGLLALNLSIAAATAMVIVNTVIYVRQLLGGGESDTALAFAVSGFGSMLVALALPRLLDRLPERPLMLGGGGLMVLGLGAGLLPASAPVLMISWFMIGAGSSCVLTPAGRLLRRSAHPQDRPAVFSAQFALSHACWLLAYPLAGWLGSAYGLPAAFLVLGAISAVATIAAIRLWPAHDPQVIAHTHQPLDHTHLHVHDEHHQHEHEGWEGPEPHSHPHGHAPVRHAHDYVVDGHHPSWPLPGAKAD